MAFLKLLEDMKDIEGYFEGNEIGVNIEYIWNVQKAKAELKFIKNFVDTYTHEYLHMLIYQNHPDKKKRDDYLLGEEKAIYSMTGHKWTKELDKFYRKYYEVDDNAKPKTKRK